jgi:hypothetical protein
MSEGFAWKMQNKKKSDQNFFFILFCISKLKKCNFGDVATGCKEKE